MSNIWSLLVGRQHVNCPEVPTGKSTYRSSGTALILK
jgi:hypothetical protein